jgi:murein DD-endopeptidase MepM/ murein hydrolase activator NlpD
LRASQAPAQKGSVRRRRNLRAGSSPRVKLTAAAHLTFQVQSYEEVLTTLAKGRSLPGPWTICLPFGARSDPFTGRWGHHNGFDLAPLLEPGDRHGRRDRLSKPNATGS